MRGAFWEWRTEAIWRPRPRLAPMTRTSERVAVGRSGRAVRTGVVVRRVGSRRRRVEGSGGEVKAGMVGSGGVVGKEGGSTFVDLQRREMRKVVKEKEKEKETSYAKIRC